MIKLIKNVYLLFYFIISFFYMEIIFRVFIIDNFLTTGILFSFLFSISFSTVFYLICSFFDNKLGLILSSILLSTTAFIFSSQFIYYKFFRTFYTTYSLINAQQVFEFMDDILSLIVKNIIVVILFYLPAIFIIAFGNKLLTFKKITWVHRGLLVCLIILSHSINVTAVHFGGKEEFSVYNLYFRTSNPLLSVEKIGLITTMRLDFQRLLIGWSPDFEESVPTSVTPSSDKAEGFEPQDEEIQARPIEIDKPSYIPPEEEKPVKEIKIEYNKMNIDFSNLISNEKDEVIKDMHKYFANVQPTSKNEYTGKYKGYNLILITAESFSPYAVRKDVTPTLYKLVNEGYNFTNFYNPVWGVSTSDGEYVSCTSLIPKSGIWSFRKSGSIYMPFAMGNQLKNLGYKTVAYHNHSYTYYSRDISHPNMGYDYKALGHGLDIKKTWPESDLEMMQKTVPEYINSQPFHAYYMTVSGHMQYSFSGNTMSLKNKKYVQDLPYSEPAKAYISAQIELDRALQNLIDQLDEAGIAEKTLIALSADHYPYGLEEKNIDELAGRFVERNFELYKSPFILYTQGMKPVTIDKPCSSLDIIPTLSNLLGLEYDSRLFMGRDIFSNSEPLVIFLNKSFITDKGRYNSKTKEFFPVGGVSIDNDYIKTTLSVVNSKFHYSAKILDTDYYKKLLKQ